jgi:hypothetical protein
VNKKAVAKNMSKKVQTPAKKVQTPRKTGISASSIRKMMNGAQRTLNAQRPVVVQQSRTISTNSSWVNAIQIERNPAWVAPRSGESYVWGSNDPNGPAAVVARRFTFNKDLDEIDNATLFLSVDNFAIVFINGRAVVIDSPQGNASFFNPGRTFAIKRFLRKGSNDIVIAAFNFPSNSNRSESNPAGVLARIRIKFED